MTIPDYTFYLTTGITVALAWNLPDKPTYPEHKHKNHLMIQHKNDANSDYDDDGGTFNSGANATKQTYLKSNKSDIVNQIANYAEYYFQNRRPDAYYFGHSSPVRLSNHTTHHHSYLKGNENADGGGIDIRPPYSSPTFHSKNPSHDATYMIETYFKPWIKSLELAMKSA